MASEASASGSLLEAVRPAVWPSRPRNKIRSGRRFKRESVLEEKSKSSHRERKEAPSSTGRRERGSPSTDHHTKVRAVQKEYGKKDAYPTKDPPEAWQVQKAALGRKFGEAKWQPRKKLSPDAVEGIKALHSQYPDTYTTPVLAEQFKVSPEVIRRILKSKWQPNDEEARRRSERWNKRGERIWTQMVELGVHPPRNGARWASEGAQESHVLRPCNDG